MLSTKRNKEYNVVGRFCCVDLFHYCRLAWLEIQNLRVSFILFSCRVFAPRLCSPLPTISQWLFMVTFKAKYCNVLPVLYIGEVEVTPFLLPDLDLDLKFPKELGPTRQQVVWLLTYEKKKKKKNEGEEWRRKRKTLENKQEEKEEKYE